MYIKDLLSQCSIADIVAVILEMESPDQHERDSIRDAYFKVIESLHSLTPVPSDAVILGIWYRDEGQDRPDVCLFSKSEIERDFSISQTLDSISDIEALSDNEIKCLTMGASLPQSYAFELSPWPEVLGYEVDQDNVREFGAAKILAATIYEMTFFGFTEEEVAKERERLNRRVEEFERVRELSVDKQAKHLISADDLFLDMGGSYTSALHTTYCEMLFNRINVYSVLKKYCNKGSHT